MLELEGIGWEVSGQRRDAERRIMRGFQRNLPRSRASGVAQRCPAAFSRRGSPTAAGGGGVRVLHSHGCGGGPAWLGPRGASNLHYPLPPANPSACSTAQHDAKLDYYGNRLATCSSDRCAKAICPPPLPAQNPSRTAPGTSPHPNRLLCRLPHAAVMRACASLLLFPSPHEFGRSCDSLAVPTG